MTEEEVALFSEFLEQREYAGPVKVQNKALKRQNLMKRHNIPTHTSEGSRTIKIEQAKGPRHSRYIPSEWVKDSRGISWRKEGTGIRIPAVERTSAQQAQEKAIQEARKKDRHISGRTEYHYGQRDRNIDSLNRKITNSEKTRRNPGELDVYRGEKHIATRSKGRALRDSFIRFVDGSGTAMNDPSVMGALHGKNIKLKGLE